MERLLILAKDLLRDTTRNLPDEIRTLVADARDVLVVVPVDESRTDAAQRADRIVDRLGLLRPTPVAEVGDPNPLVAVADALSHFSADAILLIVEASEQAIQPAQTLVDRVGKDFRLPIWALETDGEGRISPGQQSVFARLNVRAW